MAEREQQYSMADRERAVAAYVVAGTYSKAETLCGINQYTMRKWRDRDPAWWADVEGRIRLDHEQEHRAKIREIIVKGLDELMDRVEHGDFVLDKEGGTLRRKMCGRDLVIATGTMIDKLRVSLGQPTSIAGKAEGKDHDRLDALKRAAREAAIEAGKVVEMGASSPPAAPEKTSERPSRAA